MIIIGGENLIDFIQIEFKDGLPVYKAVPGGSCYNVAIASARQGVSVGYVTPISNDGFGNVLSERLLADNIKICAPRSNAPTSCAIVSMNEGQASYQFYRSGTADREITKPMLDKAFPNHLNIFHIGSLALIEGFDADLWEARFEQVASSGAITSLDPNIRPALVKEKKTYVARLLRMMQHTNILKLSDVDLEFIMPDLSVMDAFKNLCKKTHASVVILTKGANGATICTSDNKIDIPPAKADPLVDTVGAGDTFMGTILAELEKRNLSVRELRFLDIEVLIEMVVRASKAAALNCQTSGCNPPYAQDIIVSEVGKFGKF